MEVFFCICPQFFTPCIQNGGRKGQQTQQSFHHRGQPVAQGQKEGAEDLEIEDRAGEYRAHHIEPHHAALQKQGVEEECGGDQHPEQEVQQPRQQREGQAAAQDAEAVVEHPHRQPQQRRRAQRQELLGNGDRHLSGTAGPAGPHPPGGRPHR